jgi:hypothetical protein
MLGWQWKKHTFYALAVLATILGFRELFVILMYAHNDQVPFLGSDHVVVASFFLFVVVLVIGIRRWRRSIKKGRSPAP